MILTRLYKLLLNKDSALPESLFIIAIQCILFLIYTIYPERSGKRHKYLISLKSQRWEKLLTVILSNGNVLVMAYVSFFQSLGKCAVSDSLSFCFRVYYWCKGFLLGYFVLYGFLYIYCFKRCYSNFLIYFATASLMLSYIFSFHA